MASGGGTLPPAIWTWETDSRAFAEDPILALLLQGARGKSVPGAVDGVPAPPLHLSTPPTTVPEA